MKEVLPGYWMVKTPENVHQYVLQCIPEAGLTWLYFLDESGKEVARQEQLFGQWEIVGVVAEIGEDVAKRIVEHYYETSLWWKDYEFMGSRCWTAVESLLSLAHSHGFEPDQSILLNKKV